MWTDPDTITLTTAFLSDGLWIKDEFNVYSPIPWEIEVFNARMILPYVELLSHKEIFGEEEESNDSL